MLILTQIERENLYRITSQLKELIFRFFVGRFLVFGALLKFVDEIHQEELIEYNVEVWPHHKYRMNFVIEGGF